MEETQTPTTTTSFLHATLSSPYHDMITGYPSYRYQALDRQVDKVADTNNNWTYDNSVLVDTQLNGQLENPENSMAAGNGNPETNNNVNIITENDRNISLPYRHIKHASYLQNTNTHERQPASWNKQNGILQASDADTLSNHLKAVNTVELVNIKNNLESLKYLLGKFNPNSRRSVLHHLIRHETVEASQPAAEPGLASFVDNTVQGSQHNGSHLQTRTAVNPLEYYLLSFAKTGLNPPQMAAPAVPAQMDFHVLAKLLNATSSDHLNMIINKHGYAVRNLLSQILNYLQERRQDLEQHQQQHTSDAIVSGHSGPGARATYVNDPDVSFDYNKNAIKEMIRNIAKYNNVGSRLDSGRVVESFLQAIQTGHLPKAGLSDLGDMRARTVGSGDYNKLDIPGKVMLPHN